MATERDHCIVMRMAIQPAGDGMFQMFFTPYPPAGSEAYDVHGVNTNINGFLQDFNEVFAKREFGKELLTRKQCEEFMETHSGSFTFTKVTSPQKDG